MAAELLRRAVADSPAGVQHDRLAARLADALYRTGDRTAAEAVASQALAHASEPDVVVDLHWTLAQCRMRAGESEESLAALDRALASPGISARHRARLLVLAARTHCNLGEVEKAGRVAAGALAVASEADDNWAMGWALLMMALVTSVRGDLTGALPLFDRALAVNPVRSGADRPAAAAAAQQGRHAGQSRPVRGGPGRGRAGTAPGRPGRHDVPAGSGALRPGPAAVCQTGRWDEALAEVEILHEDLKEPAVVCCDLGIAAVISFHRSEVGAARGHLAAAAPHAEAARTPASHLVGSLARSLDCEHDGALPEALAALSRRVRRQHRRSRGDRGPASRTPSASPPRPAIWGPRRPSRARPPRSPPNRRSRTGRRTRCTAAACCDHDASRLLAAAERYADAGGLLSAKALEAAAERFVDAWRTAARRAAGVHPGRGGSDLLGAAADVVRLQAAFSVPTASGVGRTQKARRVVDINAQLIAGAGHGSVTVPPLEIDKRIPNRRVLRSGHAIEIGGIRTACPPRTAPFSANVLAGLRRVVRCEAVSYMEWSPQELLEFSLAADDPAAIMQVWHAYPRVRTTTHSRAGTEREPVAEPRKARQALTIYDFSAIAIPPPGALRRVCKPLGVRAVMKVFLPTGRATRVVRVRRPQEQPVPRDRPPCPPASHPVPWCRCGATRAPGRPTSLLIPQQ